MQEILLSLGGLLIVQIGLTVRKWISESKAKKGEESLKKELLNIVSDLRKETLVFKDQIKSFVIEIKSLKEENLILAKQYQRVLTNYNGLKDTICDIREYAIFSKDLKTFEYNKACYALDLIKAKNSRKKLNKYLKSFLEAGSKCMIGILYKILSYGIENVNKDIIESDFKSSEEYLRLAFSCTDLGIKKEDIENIIYTEKGKFKAQLAKITDPENGIKNTEDLRKEYLNICDKLLEDTIIGIKNL